MTGKLIGGLAALVAIVFTLGFLLPDDVHVEREIVIDAPQETVFAHIADFAAWNAWSPWAKIDPDAEFTLSGDGVGHRMEWRSDDPKVGAGSQEITALTPPSSMTTRLDFGDKGEADATFTLSPAGAGGTRVIWSLETNMRAGAPFLMKPIATYMGFFMDAMVGKDYEKGLADLKAVVEAG